MDMCEKHVQVFNCNQLCGSSKQCFIDIYAFTLIWCPYEGTKVNNLWGVLNTLVIGELIIELHPAPLLSIYLSIDLFVYVFGVLCHFQHCTGHIMMGSSVFPEEPVHTVGLGSLL